MRRLLLVAATAATSCLCRLLTSPSPAESTCCWGTVRCCWRWRARTPTATGGRGTGSRSVCRRCQWCCGGSAMTRRTARTAASRPSPHRPPATFRWCALPPTARAPRRARAGRRRPRCTSARSTAGWSCTSRWGTLRIRHRPRQACRRRSRSPSARAAAARGATAGRTITSTIPSRATGPAAATGVAGGSTGPGSPTHARVRRSPR